MVSSFTTANFEDIERLRADVTSACQAAGDAEAAADSVAALLHRFAPTCVLARVFLVLPYHRLPAGERTWAEIFAQGVDASERLAQSTPVLSLLGTAGTEYAWNDRSYSVAHRAIPLIDKSVIEAAPMIAALLSSLRVDIGVEPNGEVSLRTAAGGLNVRFLVKDAATTVDAKQRLIIAGQDFVKKYGIRTVFGMGGSYVNGELAIAILFTRELMSEKDVDRYTSLISTFKMGTATHVAEDRIYTAPALLPPAP